MSSPPYDGLFGLVTQLLHLIFSRCRSLDPAPHDQVVIAATPPPEPAVAPVPQTPTELQPNNTTHKTVHTVIRTTTTTVTEIRTVRIKRTLVYSGSTLLEQTEELADPTESPVVKRTTHTTVVDEPVTGMSYA